MADREGQPGAGPEEPLEPALVELQSRLAADLEALTTLVGGLTQEQTDWRPAPDRWSVGEALHHLLLSNRAFALAVRKLVHQGRRQGVTAGPGSRRSWPRLRSIADASASGPVKNPDRVTPTRGLPIEQLRRELADSHHAVVAQIPALGTLELVVSFGASLDIADT